MFNPEFNSNQTMTRGIEILSMVIARSGTFRDQVRRPYQTTATGETINAIQERYDQISGNSSSISSGLFDGIAANFVRPQSSPAAGIAIPNGWGTERYFFILKVGIINKLGGQSIGIYQGYSDVYDPTFSGLIDPRTVFFINGINRIINTRVATPYGVETVGAVKSSYQILANNNYSGPGDFALNTSGDGQVSMRPYDVFSTLHSNEYSRELDMIDLRSANVSTPKAAKRSHGVSASYTGEIIRGYADAVVKGTYQPGGGHLYADAIGAVAEPKYVQDEFVKAIENVTGQPPTNNFQLQDLYRLDPQLSSPLDQRIKIQRDTGVVPSYRTQQQFNRGAPVAGNTNHWHGSDTETLAATILANSLPALMVEVGIVHLAFLATNHSMVPILETKWAAGIAENYDCRPIIPMLERRIQRELIDQLSYNGQVAYQIYVDVKIAESTEISVQFENRPMCGYVSPTFADALMSPLLTTNKEQLNRLSTDFGNLVQHLVQVQTPSLEDIGSYENI